MPPFGVSARVPARPSSLLAASGATGGIDLRWIDNAGNEAGFLLQEVVAGNSVVDVAMLPANTTGYHVPGGSSGARRTFRIRAANSNGSSPYSNDAAGIVR
jgi:titin